MLTQFEQQSQRMQWSMAECIGGSTICWLMSDHAFPFHCRTLKHLLKHISSTTAAHIIQNEWRFQGSTELYCFRRIWCHKSPQCIKSTFKYTFHQALYHRHCHFSGRKDGKIQIHILWNCFTCTNPTCNPSTMERVRSYIVYTQCRRTGNNGKGRKYQTNRHDTGICMTFLKDQRRGS